VSESARLFSRRPMPTRQGPAMTRSCRTGTRRDQTVINMLLTDLRRRRTGIKRPLTATRQRTSTGRRSAARDTSSHAWNAWPHDLTGQ
jgi:hypothetical protein